MKVLDEDEEWPFKWSKHPVSGFPEREDIGLPDLIGNGVAKFCHERGTLPTHVALGFRAQEKLSNLAIRSYVIENTTSMPDKIFGMEILRSNKDTIELLIG